MEYPWAAPEESCLVDLGARGESTVRSATVIPGRRLNYLKICGLDGQIDSFDTVCKIANEEWADQRILVVALGSNASPSVMINKMNRRNPGGAHLIPIIRARIHGMGIGYFASVAPRGYIAATPFSAPGNSSEVWASLLTGDQFAALTSTEPGYTCRLVSARDYPLEILGEPKAGLRTGSQIAERPDAYYIFDADCGYLLDAAGKPLSLVPGQTALLNSLRTDGILPTEAGGDAAANAAWLTEERNQHCLIANLRDMGRVHPADIRGEELTGHALRYEEIASDFGDPPDSGEHYRVTPTRFGIDRRGGPSVVLPLGSTAASDVVALRAEPGGEGFGAHEAGVFPVVAHVAHGIAASPGTIELDQTLRDGLGVANGEYVRIEPARLRRTAIADFICGRRYLLLRAQVADHTNMETDVALAPPLALTMLGISGGDRVVIEGAPSPDGTVPEIRLRLVEMTDDVLNRREAIQRSARGLYSSARRGLGVHPDIMPILLDHDARVRLNHSEHLLVPVRVRPSRGPKIVNELRELMLVLFLGFISMVTLINDWRIVTTLMTLLICLTLVLTVARVRSTIGGGRPTRDPAPH